MCHPAWARKNNSTRRAYITVIAIPLCSLAFHVPSLLKCVVVACKTDEYEVLYQKRDTDMYKESAFFVSYLWMKEILLRVIPIKVIIILNTAIIHNYRKVCKRRRQITTKSSSSSYSEERRLIFLLGGTSLMFVIFVTPMTVLFPFIKETYTMWYNFQIFRAFCNIMEMLNYSITFYMYCIFSRDFRETFLRLCNVSQKNKSRSITRTSESGGRHSTNGCKMNPRQTKEINSNTGNEQFFMRTLAVASYKIGTSVQNI